MFGLDSAQSEELSPAVVPRSCFHALIHHSASRVVHGCVCQSPAQSEDSSASAHCPDSSFVQWVRELVNHRVDNCGGGTHGVVVSVVSSAVRSFSPAARTHARTHAAATLLREAAVHPGVLAGNVQLPR